MYEKILVAVDGSPTSLRGLDEAIKVATAMHGQLRIVHVVNELVIGPEYVPSVYYEPVVISLRESGEQVLAKAVSIARRAAVPCESKLVETLGGRAADEIVRQAQEWPANLIVLGTHGRRGLTRLATGSDAELVVRQAPVPVLMVRDKLEES